MCERRNLSVRCNAGPAEGPGKILKYRSNLRLYPVNFGNKLCILIFIILSIWLNFFDPPPLLRKTFWSPPSGNSKLFWPPSISPSPPPPPPKYLWTLPNEWILTDKHTQLTLLYRPNCNFNCVCAWFMIWTISLSIMLLIAEGLLAGCMRGGW